LSAIEGIGLKTTQKLLTHFGSLAKVREASMEDLKGVVNRTQAAAVWDHFHNIGDSKLEIGD
jgi:excinuclease UvrABC nuclease subunit